MLCPLLANSSCSLNTRGKLENAARGKSRTNEERSRTYRNRVQCLKRNNPPGCNNLTFSIGVASRSFLEYLCGTQLWTICLRTFCLTPYGGILELLKKIGFFLFSLWNTLKGHSFKNKSLQPYTWTPKINKVMVVRRTRRPAVLNFRGISSGNYVSQNGVRDIWKSTRPIGSKFQVRIWHMCD